MKGENKILKEKTDHSLGGGGFSMEPENPLLDQYIIAACGRENPVVSFLPTASGDSDWYTMKFYTAFNRYRCIPRHIPLFRQSAELKKQILDDGVAAHFEALELKELVSSRLNARAFHVSTQNNEIIEEALPVRYLGSK